ncbi:hypothetical protein C2G38_2307406 [Gigaspora rosea]|uniref:Uncharacterized protein n=1 Tax=Gigaspora rosea TaxID=44941 RepID=A0A397W4N6_9GLOM|nr:hypothetical protein C2G38_2307406 [Gigaspora rosea]CAG8517595.1 2917_t:CDS:2 [Gigaspora rosea]
MSSLDESHLLKFSRKLITFLFYVAVFNYAYNSWNDLILNNNKPTIIISEEKDDVCFPEFWKTYNPHNSCDENIVNSNFGKGCHLFVSTKNYSTDDYKYLGPNSENVIRYNDTNLTSNIGFYERITGHMQDYYQMHFENISKDASDLYSNDRVPAFVILNITLNDTLFLNNSPLSYIGIYFEQVVLKSEEQLFNVNNFYPILPGQYIIFEYSIIIVKKYSSYFAGQLGFSSDRTDAILNIETKVLPSDSNSSNIFLAILPKNHFIRYEEEKYLSTFGSTISNIGGFYGAISSISIFLFGASRLSPWGLCQTCPCWRSFRQSIKKHFAKRFISKAGILLIDDPRKLPDGATIEDRIAILESLLREHYLDTSFIEDINNSRNRYLENNRSYKEREPDNNSINEV